MTLLDVVASPATPVAHLAIVLAPGMYGMVMDGDLSPSSSFAFEVGGLVYVTVNVSMDAGNGIGSGEMFRAVIYRQLFSLEGLLENADAAGDLSGFGMVGAEVLDFAL